MSKLYLFCFSLLACFNSHASSEDFNFTIKLLREEFKAATRPDKELLVGVYGCYFMHVDGQKSQSIEASISSHGDKFLFRVLDEREVPHTEVIIDNKNDYVSSFELWGIVKRSFRMTSEGNLIIEIASKKTNGILLTPVTSHSDEIFVQYYGVCSK